MRPGWLVGKRLPWGSLEAPTLSCSLSSCGWQSGLACERVRFVGACALSGHSILHIGSAGLGGRQVDCTPLTTPMVVRACDLYRSSRHLQAGSRALQAAAWCGAIWAPTGLKNQDAKACLRAGSTHAFAAGSHMQAGGVATRVALHGLRMWCNGWSLPLAHSCTKVCCPPHSLCCSALHRLLHNVVSAQPAPRAVRVHTLWCSLQACLFWQHQLQHSAAATGQCMNHACMVKAC